MNGLTITAERWPADRSVSNTHRSQRRGPESYRPLSDTAQESDSFGMWTNVSPGTRSIIDDRTISVCW
jgi:hypothetical protein